MKTPISSTTPATPLEIDAAAWKQVQLNRYVSTKNSATDARGRAVTWANMRTRGLWLVLSVIVGGSAVIAQTPLTWPSFRGMNAAGVAEGQNLPQTWDGVAGTNVKWKV